MRVRAILLTCTALCIPAPALADPVTAFFIGLSGAGGITGALAVAIAPQAFAIGAFLGTTVLGNLLLTIGANLAFAQRPKSPSIEDARVNSRLPDATRWVMGGDVLRGADAGTFLEFDADGNFWYFMVHGDSEIVGEQQYLLDSIPVELSDGTDGFEAGDVITDDFCVTEGGDQYEGDGTRVPIWRIYTITPDKDNAYGARPAEFAAAFPSLPVDFNGVGICYSIIRGKIMRPEKRNNGYRWRGPVGIGEPSVALFSNFTRMYDPRNAAHVITDSDTWTASDGNPAIVWAWWRTSNRGRRQSIDSIDWVEVAAWADIFDTTVLNRNGDPIPLYRCGVAFPDNKPRQECEADILATCDGFVAYSDEGKAYIVGGYYQDPVITISANRDVFTSEEKTINDGERPMDGVVIEYISPDHGYTKQPCAPWVNTEYYDGVSEPNYLKREVLGCQDHNQAVRLAKAIGTREQAKDQAAYGGTIKGILLKNERGVILNDGEPFVGPHEIISNVEEDASGRLTKFAVVPFPADKWTLNEGEEGEPPQPAPILNIDTTLEVAQNVSVVAETVNTSGGAAVRLFGTFDAPSRVDRFYRFRAVLGGVITYLSTDMEELDVVSAILNDGSEYRVSWQTITAGGRATVWSDERDTPEFIDVVALSSPAPPSALTGVSAQSRAGGASFTFTGPDEATYRGVRVYRSVSGDFTDQTLVGPLVDGQPDAEQTIITGDPSGANLLLNPSFDSADDWTFGTNWTHETDRATHAAGAFGILSQTFADLEVGETYRATFTISDADTSDSLGVRLRLLSAAGNIDPMTPAVSVGEVDGVPISISGSFVATAGTNEINIRPASNALISVLDAHIVKERPASLPLGAAYYRVVPVSFSLVEGPPSASFLLHIT